MAGYIGSKAVITSGVSASIDELNLIDGVTATTAELNYNDTGAAVGVVVASKTVTADANKDVASFRNITLTGELDAGSLDISGNADIDGTLETDALSIAGVAVTTTAAELNLIDGGTARGTTAIVDADGVLINDAGTMRMTSAATLATYIGTKVGGGMEFLASSGAISDGTASVIFNQFDSSKYDLYKFFIQSVVPATDDHMTLFAQLSADGTNYDTTNGNYHTGGSDKIGLDISTGNVGGSDGELLGISSEAHIWDIHSTSKYTASNSVGLLQYSSGTDNVSAVHAVGYYKSSTAAHTAIKFLFDSGNIESGEITMFGVVKA